jgi:CHASE2 domain-containing sensor protein
MRLSTDSSAQTQVVDAIKRSNRYSNLLAVGFCILLVLLVSFLAAFYQGSYFWGIYGIAITVVAIGIVGSAVVTLYQRAAMRRITAWAKTLGVEVRKVRGKEQLPRPTPPSPPLGAQTSQPQVYLHCTHCGTLSPAGSVRCASCGAAL